jgi:hypothetical protein
MPNGFGKFDEQARLAHQMLCEFPAEPIHLVYPDEATRFGHARNLTHGFHFIGDKSVYRLT